MSKTYRQAVLAIIVNHQGHILIGYSPRDMSFKLPQGGIDPGETVLQTLKRELQEELNYQLNNNQVLNVFTEPVKYTYPTPTDKHLGQELTVIHIKHCPSILFEPQDDEFENMQWIAPNKLDLFDTDFRHHAYKKALEYCNLL